MPQFAEIVGNKIINVILADTLEDATNLNNGEYIDLTDHPDNPGIGYELVDGHFILVVEEE
jgi:hypothetical protein